VQRVVVTVAGLAILGHVGRPGHASWAASVAAHGTADIQDVLSLEPLVVSASRIAQRLPDVPATVTVLATQEIRNVAARRPTTVCARFLASACSGEAAAS